MCQARWHGSQSTYSSVVTIDEWSTCVWGALDGRSTVGGCASGARSEDEGSVMMWSSLQMSMCSDCHAISKLSSFLNTFTYHQQQSNLFIHWARIIITTKETWKHSLYSMEKSFRVSPMSPNKCGWISKTNTLIHEENTQGITHNTQTPNR